MAIVLWWIKIVTAFWKPRKDFLYSFLKRKKLKIHFRNNKKKSFPNEQLNDFCYSKCCFVIVVFECQIQSAVEVAKESRRNNSRNSSSRAATDLEKVDRLVGYIYKYIIIQKLISKENWSISIFNILLFAQTNREKKEITFYWNRRLCIWE